MVPKIIGDLVFYTLPFMTAGITIVLTMVGLKLNHNYQNSKLTQALLILDQIVIDIVKELNQTVVEELKAARADGKLTRDEAKQIKNKAVDLILKKLGMDMIKIIQASMGPITDVLSTKIEAAVFDNKRAKKTKTNVHNGKSQPVLAKIK